MFSTPVRAALLEADYDAANLVSRALTGAGISKQAHALRAKILDVDAFRRTATVALIEVHPEVSFVQMTGTVLPRKASWAGMATRRAALDDEGIVLTGSLGSAGVAAGVDDVLVTPLRQRGPPGGSTTRRPCPTPPSPRRSPTGGPPPSGLGCVSLSSCGSKPVGVDWCIGSLGHSLAWDTPSMQLKEDVKRMMCDRPAERTWLTVVAPGGADDFDALAQAAGLEPLGRGWVEVDESRARQVLVAILSKGLAYNNETMPVHRARWLAGQFLEAFGTFELPLRDQHHRRAGRVPEVVEPGDRVHDGRGHRGHWRGRERHLLGRGRGLTGVSPRPDSHVLRKSAIEPSRYSTSRSIQFHRTYRVARLVQIDAEGIAGPVVPEREQVPRKASTPGGEVVSTSRASGQTTNHRPSDSRPAVRLPIQPAHRLGQRRGQHCLDLGNPARHPVQSWVQ